MVELISPVQDFTSLKAAIDAGADAVYFGLKEFSMRAKAKNFNLSELNKVAKYCHENKVKAYLTLNTIIYENELNKIKKILKKAKEAEVDAVHAWDFSVVKEALKLRIPIHLSTQASVSNSDAAKFYKKLGISRIILARECNLKHIRQIKKKVKGLEIEVFIHGAMCVAVSGRCFTSQFLFNKSANRGECLQPCRREYTITDEEGKRLKVGSSYILSPKDLCTLPFIGKLIKAGIDAFKIEGRNRSPEYVKTVTEAYREAIDNKDFDRNKLLRKLKAVYNRDFSSGFYFGLPTAKDFTDAYGSKAAERKIYIGFVKNFYKKPGAAEIRLEAGDLRVGDRIMIQGNKTGVIEEKIISIEINNKKVKTGRKGQRIGVKLSKQVRLNDRVYVVRQS
jgi:putative protease